MEHNKEFDASGLSCPLPIVKTKKALSDMASGQVLRVIATDPGSVCDMAAFAEQTGNALLEQTSENNKFVFYRRKAGWPGTGTKRFSNFRDSSWQPRKWH